MTAAPGLTAAPGGAAAVDRALATLACLEAAPEPVTLAELSRLSGFYKSTLLRLLASLQAAGYASQWPDGRYAVGPAAVRLNLAYGRQNPVHALVGPVLAGLVGQGTESASFHVRRDDHTRLCMLRVNSPHPTLDGVKAGDVLPLDRGAAGRVLLAFSPGVRERAERALHQDGFVLSRGERDPSCAGLAAPVFGPTGHIVGALSLSGPKERFAPERVAAMGALLLHAATHVTRLLGGQAQAAPGRLSRPGQSPG